MPKQIVIEVPDELFLLIEKEEIIKKSFERIAVEAFKERVFKFLVAEELTKDVTIPEDEILAIDEKIKEDAWTELKKIWKL